MNDFGPFNDHFQGAPPLLVEFFGADARNDAFNPALSNFNDDVRHNVRQRDGQDVSF